MDIDTLQDGITVYKAELVFDLQTVQERSNEVLPVLVPTSVGTRDDDIVGGVEGFVGTGGTQLVTLGGSDGAST